MDMGHGHGTWDMDMDMGHGHGHGTWKWDMDMDMDMGHGHGHGHGTWDMDMDMDMGHGHGTWAWTYAWACPTCPYLDVAVANADVVALLERLEQLEGVPEPLDACEEGRRAQPLEQVGVEVLPHGGHVRVT
eukprot:6773684-Prymnesium_polylepis.1